MGANQSTPRSTPTPPAKQKSSASYLAPLDLIEYVAVIDAAGGELPSDIADFTQAELIEEFGMKRLHAKKLRKWLDTRAASSEMACDSDTPSPPLLPLASAGGGAAATKQSDAATVSMGSTKERERGECVYDWTSLVRKR